MSNPERVVRSAYLQRVDNGERIFNTAMRRAGSSFCTRAVAWPRSSRRRIRPTSRPAASGWTDHVRERASASLAEGRRRGTDDDGQPLLSFDPPFGVAPRRAGQLARRADHHSTEAAFLRERVAPLRRIAASAAANVKSARRQAAGANLIVALRWDRLEANCRLARFESTTLGALRR